MSEIMNDIKISGKPSTTTNIEPTYDHITRYSVMMMNWMKEVLGYYFLLILLL